MHGYRHADEPIDLTSTHTPAGSTVILSFSNTILDAVESSGVVIGEIVRPGCSPNR